MNSNHEDWLFWFGRYCFDLHYEDHNADTAVRETNALVKREGLSFMEATLKLAGERPYLFREPTLRQTPQEHLDTLIIAEADKTNTSLEEASGAVEAAFSDLAKAAKIWRADSRGFDSICRTLGGIAVKKEQLLAEFVKRYELARKRQEQKEDRIMAEMLQEERR